MRNTEMLNRIYNAYNGYDVTLEEMFQNAKQFGNTVIQSYGFRLDEPEKYKYFMIFCAWCAAADGEPTRKEYEFFVKFSGLNAKYEDFRSAGLQAIRSKQACLELRDINKNLFRSGTMYDYSANIVALCMCGCDGPINEKEKAFLNEYIRHPDYNPL